MSRQFDAKHAVLKAHPSDREAGVQLFLEYLDVSEVDFVYEEAMTPEEYIYGIRSPAPRAGQETCIDCGKCDPCDEDCPNYIDPPKRGTDAGEAISPVSADDLLKSGEAQLVPTQAIEELSEQIKARDAQLFDMERQLKAIFAECAEIALEHVEINCEGDDDPEMYVRGYDQACRDIAEAIKTRASNLKTMDAIADAALLKP